MASYQLFTVQQAAHRKGVAYHTVLRAIHSGRLPSRRLGHQFWITSTDLEAWRPKRDHTLRKYRREPNLAGIAPPLSLASLHRATLEANVTELATMLIRTAGSLSLSQLQDVSQYLFEIVSDPNLALGRPSETATTPAGGAETEVVMATNNPGARQHHTDRTQDDLAPMPLLSTDAPDRAHSVGRQSRSSRPNDGGSESERVEKRAAALSGLQSLQRELERLGSAQQPGAEASVWPGYRDVLHELVDLLRQAGEDVAPFDHQDGATTANTVILRGGIQEISLAPLLTDVKRLQAHVASGAGQREHEGEHGSSAGVA